MTQLTPSPTMETTVQHPRDVQVADVADQTQVLRSRTWDQLKFEVEYARKKGTTANSYLIQADQTALIDPPGESFTAIYLQHLCLYVSFEQLDYIVLNHVNPNRMATLTSLMAVAPQARIVCSKPAANALRTTLPDWKAHWDTHLQIVRDGDRLDLGQGHCLQFMSVKTPRWPDGLCTYDERTQVLFSDKFYGVHVCGDAVADEQWKALDSDRHYYFDCLHASQIRQVEAAIAKLEVHPTRCIAPGHGPLVQYSLSRLRYDYRQWCQEQANQRFRVAILYASAYGNTAILATAIAQGLVQAGVAVDSINCEQANPEEITRAIQICDGFMIGSPTLAGHAPTQIQTALGIVLATAAKTKLAGVFGSYGWRGEAINLIAERLRNANYRLGFDPIRVQFSPTEDTLQACQDAATFFVQALRRRKYQRVTQQGVTDTQTNRTDQAMGRIIGSLCVMTAYVPEGNPGLDTGPDTAEPPVSHRGILTSSVSQASFSPPGIMMALSKPMAHPNSAPFRGDQTCLPHPPCPGDEFVLNILKEGRNLRRHFVPHHSPTHDEDNIFSALATHPAENGCLILDDALAYLECTVQTVTECGDRWLVYAIANQGDVLEPDGITAIQHRTSGMML